MCVCFEVALRGVCQRAWCLRVVVRATWARVGEAGGSAATRRALGPIGQAKNTHIRRDYAIDAQLMICEQMRSA